MHLSPAVFNQFLFSNRAIHIIKISPILLANIDCKSIIEETLRNQPQMELNLDPSNQQLWYQMVNQLEEERGNLEQSRLHQQLKMEDVFSRFPDIGERIFESLDYKSLINCKCVSKNLNAFIENQKFYWIRIIEKYDEKMLSLLMKSDQQKKSVWQAISNQSNDQKIYKKYLECLPKIRKLLRKIRMENVREFARRVMLEDHTNQNTSLHIAAKIGQVAVFSIIFEGLGFENPKNRIGKAMFDHELCSRGPRNIKVLLRREI